MNIDNDDYLVSMQIATDDNQLMLTVTENGFGKRTPLKEYRLQGRGGSGVINVKTTKRTGNVVAVLAVTETPEIVVISQQGKIIRVGSSEIRQVGRASQGVKLIRLDEDDRVAAASLIPEDENGDDNGPEQGVLVQ